MFITKGYYGQVELIFLPFELNILDARSEIGEKEKRERDGLEWHEVTSLSFWL